MTIVVTRNVSHRIRGFLASSMLELGPGVYSCSRINSKVRNTIWSVLQNWYVAEENASIVMVWEDSSMPGGQNVRVLGLPPIELLEIDGLVVSRRDINDSNQDL